MTTFIHIEATTATKKRLKIIIMIIEITKETMRGNLEKTVTNLITRKLGIVNHGLFTPTMGTVMQLSSGKWFDWWKNEDGTITAIESE